MKRTAFAGWMKRASAEQKAELAKLAGTSVGYLYHVAHGRRRPSSAMAIALEKATLAMQAPMLKREDLALGCAECEFARRCRR